MDIPVQSYINIGMTENLTQTLNIKSDFDTSGSKCVTKPMEIPIFYTTRRNIRFEMILICSRLNILFRFTCEKICVSMNRAKFFKFFY